MGEESLPEVTPDVTEQSGLDIKEPETKEPVFSEGTGLTEEKTEEGETTETKETKEKVVFDDDQQKILNGIAAKGSQKFKDQKRITDDLQRKLDEANAKIPQSQRPDIPEMPDQYGEDFHELMATRDKAIGEAASFDAHEKSISEQNLTNQRALQNQQLHAINESKNSYMDRGSKLGINNNELLEAGTMLSNMGLNPMIQVHLLDQPTGPQITMYLSKNPSEAEALANMNPMQAAGIIATELKTKAAALFKPTDLPPDPIETLTGGGAQEADSYAIPGVKVTFN